MNILILTLKLPGYSSQVDLVEQFLLHLYEEMSTDVLWRAATDPQLEDGKQSMERFLMNRIYTHAMFPNGEGDIMRDQYVKFFIFTIYRLFVSIE